MGSSVKQEGKYQYKYVPESAFPSRMAGNVITLPSELSKEIDPRQRYRQMADQPFVPETQLQEQLLQPPTIS